MRNVEVSNSNAKRSKGLSLADSYQEKKELIKESAVRVFARYGYQKTTMDDIAGQLGIKKNSLYYYFKNKESIFDEIVNDEVKILVEDLNRIGSSNLTVRKKVMSCIHKLIYFGQERSSVYSLSAETLLEIGTLINESFSEIKNTIYELVSEILKSGVESGELKKHNSKQLAEHIVETLRAYEYKELHSNPNAASLKEIDLSNVEKRIKNLFGLVLDGLRKN